MADASVVKEWFRFANMDLKSAKYLMLMDEKPLEHICFCCQQAAEKFLKGLLISFNESIVKTHDLQVLIMTLRDCVDISDDIIDCAENLTQFAVRARYPLQIFVDESQTLNAISQAEKIHVWAQAVLEGKKV